MTYNGFGVAEATPEYEDYASFKKNLNYLLHQNQYDRSGYQICTLGGYQTTTGSAVNFEMSDSITISAIGKTEATIVLKGSADNAKSLGVVVTAVYRSNDGVSHTSIGTGTATLSSAPVAFVPAITDFYALDALTVDAANDTVTLTFQTAAGTVYGTISVNTTEATEEQMLGIGAIYGRTHTNHDDGDGAIMTLDYFTPWGEIKLGATCTINTTNGTTEVRFYESDDTTTVKDYFRTIHLSTNQVPTANTHEFLITDADCGNVDGSSNDVYACINEGAYQSYNLRFYCPEGWSAWVARIRTHGVLNNGTDSFILGMHITRPNEAAKVVPIWIAAEKTVERPDLFAMDEETDVYFDILDNAGAQTFQVIVDYIMIKNNA